MGGGEKTVRLWDLKSPESKALELHGHKEGVWELAFDPQGRWLATTSSDKTVRLWDLQDLKALPVLLRGHEDRVRGLAFDPQGRWLATGSNDKTARLWDLEDLEAPPAVLRGHENWMRALVFDPQGRWLATLSGGTVRLWELQAERLLQHACQIAGRNLTHTEWAQYLGDIPYRVTCTEYPAPSPVSVVLPDDLDGESCKRRAYTADCQYPFKGLLRLKKIRYPLPAELRDYCRSHFN